MTREDFGSLVAEYRRYPFAGLAARLAVPFLALCLALIILIGAFWRMGTGYSRFGPAVVLAWGQPWLWIGAVLGGAALLAGTWVLVSHRTAALMYRQGLLLRAGIRSTWISWAEIAGVSSSSERIAWLPRWKRSQAWLWLANGRRIWLGKYVPQKQLAVFVTFLKTTLAARLEADLRQALAEGKAAEFGPLRLQPAGLQIAAPRPKSLIPWTEIRQIDVEHGQLVMQFASGRRRSFAVDRVPNLEILLTLMRETESHL